MARIEMKNIWKRFGKTVAVKDLTLTIEDREFLVLLGPSGCGKTTTLRSIAGLETIDEGDILIDGKWVNNLRASDRDIAFVFQLYALYPHLSVYKNISFPLETQGMKKDEIDRAVKEALTARATEGRTAALVTPDRRLARRVASSLRRWKAMTRPNRVLIMAMFLKIR